MKKSLKIFTILACLALSAGFAACGNDGDKKGVASEAVLSYTLNEDGNGYTVSGCEVAATKITIPAEYNGKPVTAIGDHAFFNRSEVWDVDIPDSVTSIGDFAFSGCWNLGGEVNKNDEEKTDDDVYESIVIPDSVLSIGESAFTGCGRLTEVTIPDSVVSVGDNAFSYCGRLQKITIGKGVGSFGTSVFANCDRVSEITLSYIGESANATENDHFGYLFGASNYSENGQYVPASLMSVTISDCEEIPANAFYGCANLLTVVIGDSVEVIGASAFKNCSRVNIYSKASSLPSGWDAEWKDSSRPAYWYWGKKDAKPEVNAEGTDYVDNYWEYDDENGTISVLVYKS